MTNNAMFEWGKNCATLGYDEQTSRRCMEAFGDFGVDDRDQFWEGWQSGAREDKSLFNVAADVLPQSRSLK